jgi:uncharacterized membrane protein YphA (DoxX/SURF4 family)
VGSQAVVVGGILVGFLVIPMVAGAAPEIVNALLLLMLLGAILMNSNKWVPMLANFGNAVGAPSTATSNPNATPLNVTGTLPGK